MLCRITAATHCVSPLDATALQREDESALLQHRASMPSSSLRLTHPTTAPGAHWREDGEIKKKEGGG